MKRYAIYARFSSDVQNAKSADDQVYECHQYIEQRSGTVAGVYKDEGISGATQFRPDYQRLLKDLEAKKFDILLAEGLDRLSRNQADIAKLYELLQFHGIELHTLSEGDDINSMHIAFKGMTNSEFLKNLREKTIRGLKGCIRDGRNPGNCPYGFEPSREITPEGRNIVRGEMIRNEAEIAVIQRIFEEYAEGRSPQQIATRLNKESIPGPSGKMWQMRTINGSRKYGQGILNNETYIGRRIWGKTYNKKDPRTGKVKTFLKPESEWIIRDAPELRIISDNLWKSVKARQEELARNAPTRCSKNHLTGLRRNYYILSGKLECGCCGSNYAVISKDRYGCSNFKNKLGCTNGNTIRRQILEKEVFDLLMNEFLQEERIEQFITAYRKHFKELQKEQAQEQQLIKSELRKVEKNLKSIINAIEQGIITHSTKDRLEELEFKQQELENKLLTLPEIEAPEHDMLNEYQNMLQNLPEMLDNESARYQAIEAIRPLIDKIILHPDGRGLKGEFYGELESLVNLHAQFGETFFVPQSQISDIKGSQNVRYLTLCSIPFHLPAYMGMRGESPDNLRH
jgi:site-specific DNA recombinase